MKQFTKGILIFTIIISTILLLGSTLNAQTTNFDSNLVAIPKHSIEDDDVKINVKVLLNDVDVETDMLCLKVYNHRTHITHSVTINQDFSLYFRYNTEYTITFNHKGFYERKINIDTNCPNTEIWVINLTMRLYNDREAPNAGYIYYNKKKDSFVTSLVKYN